MDKKTDKIKKEKKKDTGSKIQELTAILQRNQADSENYRKQTEKRVQEIQKFANKDLILQLLPILDNFGLALKNVDNNQEEFVKGVELIHSQLLTILENQGVKPIGTENKGFDPSFHEALMKVASDKPENTIVEELQKGFTLNDKVIRCAKVKVSAGKKEKINVENEEKDKDWGPKNDGIKN